MSYAIIYAIIYLIGFVVVALFVATHMWMEDGEDGAVEAGMLLGMVWFIFIPVILIARGIRFLSKAIVRHKEDKS